MIRPKARHKAKLIWCVAKQMWKAKSFSMTITAHQREAPPPKHFREPMPHPEYGGPQSILIEFPSKWETEE